MLLDKYSAAESIAVFHILVELADSTRLDANVATHIPVRDLSL